MCGKLIVCSYGSSRPEGDRAELLVDELLDWGLPIASVYDTSSPEHGFVITRVIVETHTGLLRETKRRGGVGPNEDKR